MYCRYHCHNYIHVDFQIRPLNNTIARGNPVTFYCQVVSSVSISLSWRHNGTDVVYDNRVQQSVLSNGTLQLTIDPTMDGDNGNYSCVATDRSTLEEHISTAYLQFACESTVAIANFFIDILYRYTGNLQKATLHTRL